MHRRRAVGSRLGPPAVAVAGLLAMVAIGRSTIALQPAAADPVPELTIVATTGSISYLRDGGPIPAGKSSTPIRLAVRVTSSGPVEVSFAGSDFRGPATLPADTRLVRLGDPDGGLRPALGSDRGWNPTSTVMAWNPVFTSRRAVRDATFELTLRVRVPADALAGDYTGVVELTTTQPVASDADPTGSAHQEGGATADPTPGNVRPGD